MSIEAMKLALEALEYLDGYNGWVEVGDEIAALRQAIQEAVKDCHDLEKVRSIAISNLLAHFGITSTDPDVNIAYLHKQLDDFLMAALVATKGGDKLHLPLKIDRCEFPSCLSANGCEVQCPAAPVCKNDQSESALEMVAPSQKSRQAEPAEPVAWMVYTLDGKSVFVTDSPADFTEQHRALPLYTAPPPRQPLTEQEIEDLYFSEQDKWWRLELNEFQNVAQAIERKIF